ncbi:MAG: D-2-hydroxyacid dehydrogenase family protein [Acidimicrobiales bacterium]
MVRVAIVDDYQQVALGMADWAGSLAGAEVVAFADHVAGEDALADRLRGFDVVVAMRERTPFSRTVLGRLPDLRLLVTTGMRNASIDLEAAAGAGVMVCGTGGSSSATAELAWGLLLCLARHVVVEDRAVRAGAWQSTVGVDLDGKTLGVVGLGRLGSRVARYGVAFGMEVVAWSPHLTAERAAQFGARLVDKAGLFASSDFVSLHVVLGPGTVGLVGEAELRTMQPGAYLVNTSRGPVVDEGALLRALEEGWIAGAGLDVFDREPLPEDDPLRSAPRCVLTPHVGYVTLDTYSRFYGEALEDVVAYLAGTPVRVLSAPEGAGSAPAEGAGPGVG